MNLRRRFVLGAADWMAGNNGSMQNDKLLLGYSDADWEYIWMTMLEDGAWAVPGIKDANGNLVKENYAPEILIKYIAHDLRCHIIVFDLVLDSIQFISGNHLKVDNVVFDSPLLIYSTGSHFQAVLPEDHEFFIKYAKDLDAPNDIAVLETSNDEERNNISMQNNAKVIQNAEALDNFEGSEKICIQSSWNRTVAGQNEVSGQNSEVIQTTGNMQGNQSRETTQTNAKRKQEDNGSMNVRKKIKDMNDDEKRCYQREQYKKRKELLKQEDIVKLRQKWSSDKESERKEKRFFNEDEFQKNMREEKAKTKIKKSKQR